MHTPTPRKGVDNRLGPALQFLVTLACGVMGTVGIQALVLARRGGELVPEIDEYPYAVAVPMFGIIVRHSGLKKVQGRARRPCGTVDRTPVSRLGRQSDGLYCFCRVTPNGAFCKPFVSGVDASAGYSGCEHTAVCGRSSPAGLVHFSRYLANSRLISPPRRLTHCATSLKPMQSNSRGSISLPFSA